jgi:hypothetical protein
VNHRLLIWLVTIVPTVLLLSVLFLSPTIISGNDPFNSSLVLSLIGTVFSYYGLVFSLYAALQVQAISDIYFFKARSPDLQKKLRQIAKSVSEFGNEPSEDIRSQDFISEAPVAFRSAKRVKNKQVKKVAEQAETSLRQLRMSMKSGCGPDILAGQVSSYWDLYQNISELVDELSEQIKDAKV